jgi:hypothetical protein
MALIALSVKSVRRVTIVGAEGQTDVVYKSKRGSKKRSSILVKPFERVQRQMVEAIQEGAQEYLERHDKSSRKKKNGWVRDMPKNVSKAARKSAERARKAMPGIR